MGLPNEIHPFLIAGNDANQYKITNSLRFRASASAYLNRTPASAGNRKTWTFSCWVKRGTLSTSSTLTLLTANYNTAPWFALQFVNNTPTDQIQVTFTAGTAGGSYTNGVYRDPSAWYHIVLAVDTTQATDSNRLKLYVNGVQQTFGTTNYPSLNTDYQVNNNVSHIIGGNSGEYFDGYLTEVNFIDGQALTPSSFGAYDTNGVWQPARYTGSYGTNGFYLPFSGNTPFYSAYLDGTGDYVSTTLPSGGLGAGNFTIEYWMYNTSLYNYITALATTRGTTGFNIGTDASGYVVFFSSGARQIEAGSVQVNRWNHFAYVRNGSTLTAYLNGVSVQSATVTTDFSATALTVGCLNNATEFVTGYMSTVRIVVGTAVYTSNFTPPTSPLTNISNTKLLTFQSSTIVDNSSSPLTLTVNGNTTVSQNSPPFSSSGVGSDFSGNSNNWSPFNISLTSGTTYDSMKDVPTNWGDGSIYYNRGNYPTLNPISNPVNTIYTLSNGNLTYSCPSSAGNGGRMTVAATMALGTGKYYWEVLPTDTNGGFGLVGYFNQAIDPVATANPGNTLYILCFSGIQQTNNITLTYTGTTFSYAVNDIIGLAYDGTAGTLAFYKNGILIGTYSGITTNYLLFPGQCAYASASATNFSINFGQRPFTHTPPVGFVALNSYNLANPSLPLV